MPNLPFPRPARLLAFIMLATCAVVAPAASSAVNVPEVRMVVAQAPTSTPPAAETAANHEHAAPAAIPDPNPKLNKKRAAFWGVSFMLATSLAFAIFGTWAIKKTPKPGQQRPE